MRIKIEYITKPKIGAWCSAEFEVCPRIGESVRFFDDTYKVVWITHDVSKNGPAVLKIWLEETPTKKN
jgi:hypothetical protein